MGMYDYQNRRGVNFKLTPRGFLWGVPGVIRLKSDEVKMNPDNIQKNPNRQKPS